MAIVRIAYNEMRCDEPGCEAKRRVYEGCPSEGWTGRVEGSQWDGKTGGWYEAHYCPAHQKVEHRCAEKITDYPPIATPCS